MPQDKEPNMVRGTEAIQALKAAGGTVTTREQARSSWRGMSRAEKCQTIALYQQLLLQSN